MTLEELRAGLAVNPELSKGIITIVQEETFGKDFLTNYSKAESEKIIGTRIGELHGQYDKDILEATGISKKEGEKSYEYAKRAISEIKSKGGDDSELQALKAKNIELEQRIKEDGGAKFINEQFEAAKNTWNQKEKNFQDQISQLNQQMTGGKITSQIQNGMIGLKFNSELPESVRESYVKTVQSEISKNAVVTETGDVVFKGPDGSILMDKTTYTPMTAEAILKERLSDILDAGKKQAGGGTGDNKKTIQVGSFLTDSEGKNEKIDISACKSKTEITTLVDKICKDQGVAKGSPRHSAILTNSLTEGKDLPMFSA